VELFLSHGVLSRRELESRHEVFLEQYITKLNIEAETAVSIARTMLLPAAARHLAMLLEAQLSDLATEASDLISEFTAAIQAMEAANLADNHPHEPVEHARYMRETVIPAMNEMRAVADRLERIVADDLWPLPRYSEILFIK
jgi:glutamine synthetase